MSDDERPCYYCGGPVDFRAVTDGQHVDLPGGIPFAEHYACAERCGADYEGCPAGRKRFGVPVTTQMLLPLEAS